MKHTDKWIADGMRTLAEREPPGEAPVDRLVSRGRRVRKTRAVLAVSASSLALALAAAGTVALLPGARGGDPAVPPASTAPASVAARLADAAAATAGTSYKLRYTDSVMPLPGVELTPEQQRSLLSPAMASLISEGAYDGRTLSGYLIQPQRGGGSTREQRLVNGEQYIGPVGGPFQQNPGRHERLSYPVIGAAIALLPWVEPAQLLAHLGALEDVTETGPHTYRFRVQATAPPDKGGIPPALGVTGDVTVGAASGLVEKVILTAPVGLFGTGRPNAQVSITIEFSGFGEPVVVQRPEVVSSVPSGPAR